MDLRAMLNTDGTGDRGAGAGAGAAGAGAGTGEATKGTATTTPGASGGISATSSSSRQLSQPPAPGPVSMPSPSITMNGLHGTAAPSSVAPVTPVQTGPPHNAFRNYSHSTHASPVMQHHDYPPSAASYQSPTSYHPPPPGPFGNRPHVPPIQPPGHGHSLSHDTRSPGTMPAPSPSYRQTPPASSMNPGAQGYPFPPTSQPPPPASPSQRQQQYSSQAGYGPRDSYSSRQQSPVPPPIGMPTMPSRMSSQGSAASSSPYGQGPHPSQQQQQSMPQTPPIGTPGGVSGSIAGGAGAAYIQHQQHQRSLSVQSVTTPTSAHSQQPPFGPPYVQGSPVTTAHQALPQQQHLDRHPSQRQSSQPPTPLGPPMSGPIRQSPAQAYREPLSPYQQTQQQRTSSSATIATITNIPYPPQPQPMQTSPPPPAPATIQQQKQQFLLQQQQQQQHHQHLQRLSNSSYNAYDVAAASDSHRRSTSQHSRSERERSISVSPKTRVPSLPSSISSQDILHHPLSRPPALSQSHSQPQAQPQTQPPPPPQLQPQPLPLPLPASGPTPTVPAMDVQRDVTTPAKRKLDDRNLSPDELQSNRRPPQPAAPLPGTNGNHVPSDSPNMPRPKRVKYNSTPTWAQSVKGVHLNASRNFSLKQYLKKMASGGKPVNGNAHPQDGGIPMNTSRHASPETARSAHTTTVNTTAPAPAVKVEDHPVVKPQVKPQIEPPVDPAAMAAAAEPGDSKIFNGKNFPWEPSIDNQKPIDLFSKAIGDFLYLNVLSNSNLEEIRSRKVQFEIEAKLGIIIDKATNDRIVLPVSAGECVMSDEARIAFRSSMTESQHRGLNQWLNHQVRETHPHNPKAASRLEIKYEHRRETDRFFELPASRFIQHLPYCVSSLLPSTSTLKARVTYHQQTDDVLAKIIKGRVADLNIHFPHLPLDCRVSVNLEWDWEGSAEEIIYGQIPNRERQPDRNKDRLSYTHGFYQVDLTQVTAGDPAKGGVGAHVRPMDKEHELEVELDANAVLEHGNLLMTGQASRFENLIDGFADNIRVLARKCPPN